jgi:uncharacterized lipoprotein YddW (UPF0748 family)
MVHQGLNRRRVLALATAATLGGCANSPVSRISRVPEPHIPELRAPEAPREFRGAWVATVANIDWPSKSGLSAAEQQAEVRTVVARAVELGLNALLLQVRTSADALYSSRLEPWSEYLTGTQGVDPGYDPLAFWIQEAHAHGIELHAWFNPYRARQSAAQSALASSHVSQSHPSWVKSYGKQLWIDPGEPEAARHTLAVYRDVLSRYDIDGLHIDDYFYPYPEKDAAGNEVDFPDDASYAQHGNGLNRADWRRQNVNQLVEAMFKLVREVRPTTRLGISPFGLMRPGLRPAGIEGFSQYDKLYADVELWLKEGWLDYLVPQLYWPMNQAPQAFGTLLNAWLPLNPQGRHLWAGLYTSRVNDSPQSWQPEEVSGQIALTREIHPGSGHVHFSMVALLKDHKALVAHLKQQSYAQPALPPATPWLGQAAPAALTLTHVERVGGPETWRLEGGNNARRLLLWWREAGRWQAKVLGPQQDFSWPQRADALVASAFNATGIEGPRRAWIKR